MTAALTACGPSPQEFQLTGLPGIPCEVATAPDVLSGTVRIGIVPPVGRTIVKFGIQIGGAPPQWSDAPPFQISLDTTGLPDGDLTVAAQAWVENGGLVSLAGTACIDNHGPSLIVIGPADEETRYLPGADLAWDVRADDPSGLAAVGVTIALGGQNIDVPCTSEGDHVHCQVALSQLAATPPDPPAIAGVRITAADRRGHQTVDFRHVLLRSRVLWATDAGAPIEWTPARAPSGMLLVATSGDFLAVRPDGTTACRWPLPRPQPDTADPAGTGVALSPDGATAYFGTLRHFYAVDTASCAPRWGATTPLDGTYQGSTPAVDARTGVVYVGRYGLGAEPGEVLAIAPDSTLMWKLAIAEAGAPVGSSPVLDPNARRLYIGSSDRNLYAVDLDGHVVWTFLTGDSIMSGPALAGERVYVGSHDGLLYAVDRTTGARDLGFTVTTRSRIQSSPAVAADGTVYVASLDGNIYAAAPDGTVRWTYGADSLKLLNSSPVVDPSGLLHLASTIPSREVALFPSGGEAWTFDPAPGGPVDQVDVSASPVLGQGVVYVGTKSAKLYALGTTP